MNNLDVWTPPPPPPPRCSEVPLYLKRPKTSQYSDEEIWRNGGGGEGGCDSGEGGRSRGGGARGCGLYEGGVRGETGGSYGTSRVGSNGENNCLG